LGLMDQGARDRAAALTGRVWIDADEPRKSSRTRHAIERALADIRIVSLTYHDRHGVTRTRKVDPIVLAHTRGHWYFVAHCQVKDDIRWFPIDRVVAAD
jgi:predicted DNA-binding transcriptional regulator YafY